MKYYPITLPGLTAVLCLSMGVITAHAQQFEASRSTPGSDATVSERQTKDGKVIVPSQHSSVVVMMSEHGLEVFSPGADPSLGRGEKLVTEPAEHEGRIGNGQSDRKPYGGIRLFGWFF